MAIYSVIRKVQSFNRQLFNEMQVLSLDRDCVLSIAEEMLPPVPGHLPQHSGQIQHEAACSVCNAQDDISASNTQTSSYHSDISGGTDFEFVISWLESDLNTTVILNWLL